MDWPLLVGVVGAWLVALLWLLAYRYRIRQLKVQILGELERGPAYGLQLMTNLEVATGKRPNPGILYPTLRAMEREGVLASENRYEAAEVRGGRPRRYYWLVDE